MYSASEVFQHALQMETDGERMYRYFADKIYDQRAKTLFLKLAQEEVSHKKFFEKTVNNIENYSDIITYPEEYFNYIKILAENLIFSKDKFEIILETLNDELEATNFAIRREMDSILYYYELKKTVKEDHRHFIDEIIAEEERHFTLLNAFKLEIS